MMELQELRGATNWKGIFQGRDCPVIIFDESDAGLINGLDRNDDCFFLKFPEYQKHPISFLVSRGPETFQYWVLGDRLHRNHKPAKITANEDHKTSYSGWFRNGLLHNDAGPAEVYYRGYSLSGVHPRTQEDISPDYIAEEWNEMEAYWFEEGESSKYPKPFSALASDGYRLFRATGNIPVLDDLRDEPAFFASKLVTNWGHETDYLSPNETRIRFMKVSDYFRQYSHGQPGEQGCSNIDLLTWIVNGETKEVFTTGRENIRNSLFSAWNVWEGPLFADEQEEIFAMVEVNR